MKCPFIHEQGALKRFLRKTSMFSSVKKQRLFGIFLARSKDFEKNCKPNRKRVTIEFSVGPTKNCVHAVAALFGFRNLNAPRKCCRRAQTFFPDMGFVR